MQKLIRDGTSRNIEISDLWSASACSFWVSLSFYIAQKSFMGTITYSGAPDAVSTVSRRDQVTLCFVDSNITDMS